LIENQTRRLLNDFARDLQQRGVDLNKVESDFLQMAYHNMRQQAERDVRGAMLLDKIGGIEKVEVTDGEVDEEISRLADYYHASPEELRESMEKQGGGVEDIRGNLKTRKTIEAVVSHASVTDGPWQDEKTAEVAEPAEPKPEKPKKTRKKKTAETE
jgi:trigger factor